MLKNILKIDKNKHGLKTVKHMGREGEKMKSERVGTVSSIMKIPIMKIPILN